MVVLASLQDFVKVCQAFIKSGSMDTKIVHEHLHGFLDKIRKNSHHGPLESSGSIAQTEGHPGKCICPIRACESCFPLVTRVDGKLVETRVAIEKTKEFVFV